MQLICTVQIQSTGRGVRILPHNFLRITSHLCCLHQCNVNVVLEFAVIYLLYLI